MVVAVKCPQLCVHLFRGTNTCCAGLGLLEGTNSIPGKSLSFEVQDERNDGE